jgi:hypothetical protein
MTGKFARISWSQDAQFTVAFSASEALLSGFSFTFYYPLVSRVDNWAQIANKIVALLKTEFFNTIGQNEPMRITDTAKKSQPCRIRR